VEFERELVADLVVDASRHADAAGLRRRLDARRDVDAIAEQIGSLHDHVAEVDADPELHALLGREMVVARAQRRLDLGRAAHRVDRARELGEHRVAGRVEHAAAMLHEHRVEDLAVAAEDAQRAFLVRLHHPAVADDVGHQDRR
jgi:hypothetical protein